MGKTILENRRKRWTEAGRGASLGSQRRDFRLTLQSDRCRTSNDGRSSVYAYLRDKDSPSGKAGSPYYVGVAGYPERPYAEHRRGGVRNRSGDVPVPADERRIRLLRGNVTHEQAREWERYYIKKFGRKNADTGRRMLLNRTDGGEGTSGQIVPERVRNAVGEANKRRVQTEEAQRKKSAKMKQAHKDPLLAAKWKGALASAQQAKLQAALAKYDVSEEKWKALTAKERLRVAMRYKRGDRGNKLFRGL